MSKIRSSSNIDYGEKDGFAAAVKDIKKAAEIGQSKEFIEKKEGTYQAHVEEGGANFSGGQKQRLTISRAICRKTATSSRRVRMTS